MFIYRPVERCATFLHGIYVFVCILLHLEGLEADADALDLLSDLMVVQLATVSHQQILSRISMTPPKRPPRLKPPKPLKNSFVADSLYCHSADLRHPSSCNSDNNSLPKDTFSSPTLMVFWSTRPFNNKESTRRVFVTCWTAS